MVGADTHPIYVGADAGNTTPAFLLTGSLDEVVIYGHALTPAEVAQLAAL